MIETQRKRKQSQTSLNIQLVKKGNEDTQTRYKSLGFMIMMGFTIAICALMFGYGLTQISTIPIDKLVQQYGINFSASVAQGILIGLMPFGGVFGAFFFKYLLAYFSRKKLIFFLSIFMLLSMGLMQIKTVQTLFIGRFIEGLCVANYVSLGPIYIRQVVARQLRPQLMSIFSLCKVLGIVIAYSLQNIFEATGYEYGWRFLMGFNTFFCIIQVAIVFFFIPDSPVQMVQKKEYYQARKILQGLYNQAFVQEVLDELKKDYQAQIAKTKPAQKMGQLLKAAVSYTKNRGRALLMAYHVQSYKNFIGANVLVTFSGQIISPFSPILGQYTALIINILQLICNTISTFVITKNFGRRPLFLIGSLGLTIFNIALAIVLVFQLKILIFIMMCSYMLLYGATFLPISWSYPSEIIPAEQSVYPNIIYWLSLWIVVSVPPIVVGAMPDHNAYPLFFFFGLYGGIGFIYLLFKMVESKGRTYQQIIKQF